jgi:hypothetical protein
MDLPMRCLERWLLWAVDVTAPLRAVLMPDDDDCPHDPYITDYHGGHSR